MDKKVSEVGQEDFSEPLYTALEELINNLSAAPNVKAELRRHIRKFAEVDGLTRCVRSDFFRKYVTDALRKHNINLRNRNRRSEWITLMVFDVSRFKMINDSLGHPIGDAVLNRLGRILRSSIRHRQSVDIAGRMGGDEFAALLTQVNNVEGVLEVARRLKDRVLTRKWEYIHPSFKDRPIEIDIGMISLSTASIEDVKMEEIEEVAAQWWSEVDQLMYRSKRAKGDIYYQVMQWDRSSRSLQICTNLRRLSLKQEDRRHQ